MGRFENKFQSPKTGDYPVSMETRWQACLTAMAAVKTVKEPVRPRGRRTASTQRRQVMRRFTRPGRGLHFLVSFLTFLIGVFPAHVAALPSGGTVAAGQAQVSNPLAGRLDVTQQSQRAIIDWIHYNIQNGEHVHYQLPSSDAVNLSRVTGGNPSEILGKLTSNGNLFLINPNGILFGSSAVVDVNGLVATTSDITNENFMSGNYQFNIGPEFNRSVINRGSITVAEGGLAAFVAPGVENSGTINARLGRVSLASGNTFTLDLYGDQLVNLDMGNAVTGEVFGADGNALTSLVRNSGGIFADGGMVQLQVGEAQALVDHAINMDGVIQAQSLVEKNGEIYLSGGPTGTVEVTGTLDASGYDTGRTGGTVHVLGDTVLLYDQALIDVSGDQGGGTLLFGGDFQGNGLVQNATDTFAGRDTAVYADAVNGGDGGRVIFWADRRTYFFGRVRARGGIHFGDGGFVEVSGKEELVFDGTVDTSAPNGNYGTLLLDPQDIVISDGFGAGSVSLSTSGAVTFVPPVAGDVTITEFTLETLSATTNLELKADRDIILNSLVSDGNLSLPQTSGVTVTFDAGRNIEFKDATDKISTANGNLTLAADGNMTLGSLNAGTGTISILGGEGDTIGLGTATGDITLNNTVLENMTAGNLVIGGLEKSGNAASQIFVNGVTTGPTVSGTTTLNALRETGVVGFATVSGGKLQFNGSNFFSKGSLVARANNGIQVNGNLTAADTLSLDGDFDNQGDQTGGPDNIIFADGIALKSNTDGIILDATTGKMGSGILTLNSFTGIQLNDTLNSSNADITFTGPVLLGSGVTQITTGAGGGNLIFNSTLDAAVGNTVNLTLNSGTGTTTFGTSAAHDIGGINPLNSLSILGNATFNADVVRVNNGITLNGTTFSAPNGISFNADLDVNGVGLFAYQAGALSTTGDNPILIAAQNLDLGGTLNSGNGLTSFISTSGGLDLGTASTGLSFNLSNGELANITAGSLSVSSGANNMVVAGLTNNFTNGGTTLTGSTVNFSGTNSFNTLTLNGSVLLSNATVTTNNTDLTISGPLSLLGGPSSLSTGAGGGNLAISGSINSAQTLSLNSGTGTVTFGGNVGDTIALTGLTVSGNTTFGGNTLNTTGALTFNNALTLGSTATMTSGGGAMNFAAINAAASGVQGLSLNSGGGAIAFNGTIGGTNPLSFLTVTGPSTLSASNITTTSGMTFNSSLALTGGTALNTGTGTLTLNGITGNQALTLTSGLTDLNGTLAVASLTDNTGKTLLGSSTITASTGNVTFSGNVELDSGAASIDTSGGGGDINFTGTVNGDQNLAVNSGAGTTTFSQNVGATTALNSLTTTGTTALGASATTVKADDGISFGGNVNSSAASLSINADSDANGGIFTQSAATTLASGGAPVTVTASDMALDGSLNTGAGATTLNASLGTGVDLGTAGSGGFKLLSAELGRITAGSLTVNAGSGNMAIQGVANSFTNGTALSGTSLTFTGVNSFTSLGLTGNVILNGATVSTANTALNIAGGLTLAGGASSLSTGAGGGNLAITGAINGAQDLTLNAGTGSVSFANVGNTTALNSLTVSGTGGTSLTGNTITTLGNMTFNSGLAGTTTLTLTADSDGNGAGTIDVAGGTVSTGGNLLTLSADDLTLTGSLNSGAAATVINVQDVGGISLGGAAGGLALAGAELANIMSTGLTLNGGTGGVTANGVTGVHTANTGALTLNGTSATFNTVDSTFAGGLVVNAASVISGINLFTTAQPMTFNSAVTLNTGAVQLGTSGGALSFASTINGAQALTLTPGAGLVTFGGNIGDSAALASLSLTGTGVFNGSSIATTGNLTLNGGFTAAGTVAINTGAGLFDYSGGTFSTSNGNLNLTTDNITLGGSINTGSGSMSVTVSDGGTLGLGNANCGGACGLTLDGNELQAITTSSLFMGSSGAVFADGVTSTNSQNIASVTLQSGGTATFDNTNTFQNLDILADDVAINGGLSVGTNTLALRTSDGGSIGAGAAAGDMTLDAAELAFLTAGTFNLGDSTTASLTLSNVDLTTATITQAFNAFTAGALSVQTALVSPVTTTLSSAGVGQGITLNQTGTVIGGPLSLFTGSGGNVVVSGFANNGQALTLGNSTIGGALTVSLPGAVNVAGAVTAAGNASLASLGSIAFTDGASFNSSAGLISVTTPGNLVLGRLFTGSGSASAITLNVGGAVSDAGDVGGADIAAPSGGLVALTGAGFGTASNPIETQLAYISLINSGGGDIAVFETDSLVVSNLEQQGEGALSLSFSGTLTGFDNILRLFGEPEITDRLSGFTFSQELGTTGKQRDRLALERTINNVADFETSLGLYRHRWEVLQQTPASDVPVSGIPGRAYGMDPFGNLYPLVILEPAEDGSVLTGEGLENLWEKVHGVKAKKQPEPVASVDKTLTGEQEFFDEELTVEKKETVEADKPEEEKREPAKRKKKKSGVKAFFEGLFN